MCFPQFLGVSRVSGMSFFGGRDRVRNGDPADIEDKGGVSRQNDDDFLRFSVAKGVGYCGGALQCNIVCASAC